MAILDSERKDIAAKRIEINGIVQGVGFRPFIYQLANQYEINGEVANTSSGVSVFLEGTEENIEYFCRDITEKLPPLAHITDMSVYPEAIKGFRKFSIKQSRSCASKSTLISPDISVCNDCLKELFDPNDRRYLYPFINCTNCGPRYTIIENIPYDRPYTSMKHFKMCEACQAEYDNPNNRRFHAQPNACPVCGPHVSLYDNQKNEIQSINPVEKSIILLKQGYILAIKGLGGFHLAADAQNHDAIMLLRKRKRREEKPFAIMMYDVESIRQYAKVDAEEEAALTSFQHPILLLRKKYPSLLSEAVSPGNNYLGVMLPYTPLHYLLLRSQKREVRSQELRACLKSTSVSGIPPFCKGGIKGGFELREREKIPPAPLYKRGESLIKGIFKHDLRALIMTSGNMSEEPIAIGNEEAFERLSGIADYFLIHNRDIYLRSDDSIIKIIKKSPAPRTQFIRRSRGYVPFPVFLKREVPQILACGAELKNTVCLTKGDKAFLSQHIGDMENLATYQFFQHTVKHLKQMFGIHPEIIAHDLHPDYMSTRYAQEQHDIKRIPVQHHHAHIVSCMAENMADGPVIGLAFDGTGYGTDGNIWGGEVLIAEIGNFTRAAHLAYIPMPGGAAAIKEPWRMGISYLYHTFGDEFRNLNLPILKTTDKKKTEFITQMIDKKINSPYTSSMGRLFDGVAAIMGIRNRAAFEGQAAMEMEMLAEERIQKSKYDYEWQKETFPLSASHFSIPHSQIIRGVVNDLEKGISLPEISRKFHITLISLFSELCEIIREESSLNCVALSGGVFQNSIMLNGFIHKLEDKGFQVLTHTKVPSNDGGISLGQALIAAEKFSKDIHF